MQFKTVKTVDTTRIVEVTCSLTGDLVAIVGVNSNGIEIEPLYPMGAVDARRLTRHLRSWYRGASPC